VPSASCATAILLVLIEQLFAAWPEILLRLSEHHKEKTAFANSFLALSDKSL
jgi:hypothetical protein